MDPRVRYALRDSVAVVTVDNPPVNALSPGIPETILALVRRAAADASVKATVLIGAGRGFIAGADIRKLGTTQVRPPVGERLWDLLDLTEKPLVAAIHGHALGGGLETALACHYRLAKRSARVGMPEVQIGVIPGAGGTQRIPRLVGLEAAIDLIAFGRQISAPEALRHGILDRLVPDDADLEAEAVAFALSVADIRPLRVVRELAVEIAGGDVGRLFADAQARLAKKARGLKAPFSALEVLRAAVEQPFNEGLLLERKVFEDLEATDQAKALRYAFFAERQAVRPPENAAGRHGAVTSAAVVGAGTMGGGIAMALANSGVHVAILDVSVEALQRGMDRVKQDYAAAVRRGSLTEPAAAERLALIRAVTAYEDIGGADVVIEAAFEEIDIKKAVFGELDRVMKPDALLLTNTSTIDIDLIAAATSRPAAVAGAHFFSPANVMKLLEVVEGRESSAETIAAAMRLGKQLGKVSVRAGNTDGFVANRSRGALADEAAILVEHGLLPEQIDRVMVDFGYAMGPLAVADLAGLDVGWAVRKRRARENPDYRKHVVADRLCEMGRYGQKTGAGWYRYAAGSRMPVPDPVVTGLIAEICAGAGRQPGRLSDEEVLHRLLFASVNEACRILDEKKAYRASDIDVMWVNGFGFPRHRGGLLYWADSIGARRMHAQVERWFRELGPRWRPAASLTEIAANGAKLSEIVAAAGA